MDQRKLYNFPASAEVSYGLQRYLKPGCDVLGGPHKRGLAHGTENDGKKGMSCRVCTGSSSGSVLEQKTRRSNCIWAQLHSETRWETPIHEASACTLTPTTVVGHGQTP